MKNFLSRAGIFICLVSLISCAAKTGIKRNPSPKQGEIVEVYWKLVEINGNTIESIDQEVREPHLILKSENKQVVGNGGCNGFSGIYELPKGNGIRFLKLISTKMACIDITYENEFFNILGRTDNYSVMGDTLRLQRDTDIIAKLVRKDKK